MHISVQHLSLNIYFIKIGQAIFYSVEPLEMRAKLQNENKLKLNTK